jgi:O-antigen/teichoic acid export membrane protein
MQVKNRLLGDLIKYIPSKILPAIMGLISIAYFTRLLSPYEYGSYELLINTVNITEAILISWLYQSSLRYYKKYENLGEESKFIATGLQFIVIIWISISILYLIFNNFIDNFVELDYKIFLYYGLILLGVQGLYKYFLVIIRGRREADRYSLFVSLETILKYGLAILVLIYTGLRVKGILIVFILVFTGFIAFELIRLLRNNNFKTIFSMRIVKELFNYGFPLIGASITHLILSVGDRYMINYFLGTVEVGIYSAGYRLSQMSIQNFYLLLMLAAYPIIIRDYENKGREAATLTIKKSLNYYFILLIPIVIGVWALAGDIVEGILGREFARAQGILPLIALGTFFYGLSQYANKPFELKEKTSIIFYMLVFSAVLNIGLNIYFIPVFGIAGAAYTTLISYAFYLIILTVMSRRFIPLNIDYQTLYKTVLAAMIMFLGLRIINIYLITGGIQILIFKILIGAFLYFLMLLVLNEENIRKLIKGLIS